MKKIYCIGGATLDHKLKSLHTLELATSNPVSSFSTPGGVARNIAENLANLTQHIYLQCVIGDDHEGQRILAYLQNKGVHTERSLCIQNQTTARYYAILDQFGELHIALSDMDVYNHIPFEEFTAKWDVLFKDNIILIDTNVSPEILEYAIQLSQQKQLMLCVDVVSMVKAKKLPVSLAGIFLMKLDQHEARALTDIELISISDCFQAGEKLLQRGVQHVVITLGSKGYVVVDKTQQKHFPAMKVNAISDVSGAGDAFFAGVLAGLQQQYTLQEACQFGAVAAALTIQSPTTVADIAFTDLIRLATQQQMKERDNNAEIF